MRKYPSLSEQDLLDVHSKVDNSDELERIFNNYKKRIFFVSNRYDSVLIEHDDIWSKEYFDRTWLFWHHSLVSVAFLIDSYNVDMNKEKIDLAYEIIKSWYKYNYPDSPIDMGWHDHSTALRLLHIVKLYLIYEELGVNEKKQFLIEIAETHMHKLSDPDFYMPKHNHGLDQDIVLYYASTIIKDNEKSVFWNKLSLERFWNQINNIFAEDGSYLEHSPQYIYFMLERLLNFYKVLTHVSQEQSKKLMEKIEKIATFFIYTIQPDGTFPSIGDSEIASINIDNKDWSLLPNNLYSVLDNVLKKSNDVNEDNVDLPLDVVYSAGDYAFFRSDWKNDHNTKQLIFYSAFHSRVHKHHDDLAFTLYAHGIPLLIDAGKFTYQYDRLERKYVVSAFGHNTVRINNRETDLKRLNVGKSGILSWRITRNICYVSGFHSLIDGVTHRRIIIYLKPDDLIILDIIKGSDETNAEIIFNLNPEVQVTKDLYKYIGLYKEKSIIFIENLLKDGNYSVSKGETPFKGWNSPTYGKMIPNNLISLSNLGSYIKFATHIRTSDKNSLNNFYWNNDVIRFNYRSFDVKIKLSDYYEYIFINNKLYKTSKVYKEKLLESLTENNSEYIKSSIK